MYNMEPLQIDLREEFLELVRRASTQLPEDVVSALQSGMEREKENPAAASTFKIILDNVKLAREGVTPICQDTGTPIFVIFHPFGYSQLPPAPDRRRDCGGALQGLPGLSHS
jgi:fumarate hydratase class I